MHLAGQAGIHECLPYGKREGHPSGHYMRHVKDKLPTATYQGQLYNLEAPAFAPDDSGPMRGVHKLTCCLPHEVMDADSSDGASLKLDEAIESGGLPPCYWGHPIVQQRVEGEPLPQPCALYLDGVSYSNVDTVIGFWAINIITEARFLVVALRKKLLCRCGCRGWCTLFSVFELLRWSFNAAAEGVYPTLDHQGKPWRDERRSALASKSMRSRYVLLFIKGDWSEYVGTLGFPAWNDGFRPCFACNAAHYNIKASVQLTAVALNGLFRRVFLPAFD